MSALDPRDERFLVFLRETEEAVGHQALAIPERSAHLAAAGRAVSEGIEARLGPPRLAPLTVQLAGWALSPDPASLEAWALETLRSLRRDPVRARNITGGVTDWVVGQLRGHIADLRWSWQVLSDLSVGYPIDTDRPLAHPAAASACVAAWSYAVLRSTVAQHARGLRVPPTTLAQAAAAGGSRSGIT